MAAISPRDELIAVCRRVLDDPMRGEADVTRIGACGAPDALLRALARLLPGLPDPDLALVHLERYCREGPPPEHPESLQVLMTLLGFSPYLAEAIINDRGWLPELLRARRQEPWGEEQHRDALARWRRITQSDDPWDALRSFKRRMNLRIALRDLERRTSLSDVGREISFAADALLQSALEIVLVEAAAAHGHPQAYDPAGRIVEATLSVVSLGKLGGLELNYSSDVDLLFLYSRDGETTGVPGRPETQISNKMYFTQVAERLAEGLRHVGAEGQVFRVDCRLRPGGRDGDLVVSLEAATAYYRTWARSWELQALIKARHSAGDAALAARFLAGMEPVIYPEDPDRAVIDGVREMKDRIDAELARRGVASFHLKLGRGGIREIEFTAQALQLIHAGSEPWLREGSTLMALHRLADKGLLSAAEHGALSAAYVFLREAEHRLQLHRNLQRSVVPSGRRERRVMARALGYNDGPNRREADLFDADLEKHRTAVRSIYDAVLARLAQASLQDISGPDPFLDVMSDRAVEEHLRAHDVPDPAALLGSIQSMARLFGSPSIPPAARRALRRATPVLLKELAGVHNRIRAIRTLERFLESLALEPEKLESLCEHRELFGPLVRLFAGSQALSSILIHRPGAVLETGFGAAIARDRTVEEHVAQLLRAVPERPPAEGAAGDLAGSLRMYQRTHFLYIGLKELSRQAGAAAVQRSLSTLAEALLRVCVLEAARGAGWPVAEGTETPGFFALGLGKLGYGELDFASDLDLVFLYEAGASEDAPRHARANEVARRVMEMLTTITREGSLYAVDNRLRPFGTQGELAQPVEGAAAYMGSTAGVWEMQSFLKARCVAGDLRLGESVTARIEADILARAGREDLARSVREMRERLLLRSEGEGGRRIDIKLGEGGLSAIQFAVQYLQLRTGIPSPPLKRTTRVLATLRGAGVLDGPTYRVLFTGFRFLRRLEHHLRLVHGRALSSLPESGEALGEIAAAMGYGPTEGEPASARLLADVARTRRRVEAAFRRVIEQESLPRTRAFS